MPTTRRGFNWTGIAAGVFLLGAAMHAEQPGERDHFLGNWQVQQSTSQETWTIESKGGELRIYRTDDGKITFDAKCKPDGDTCKGIDEGKKMVVTMYFSSRALVQMETKESNVTTRTFALGDNTDRMSIDVHPITGQGKRETLQLSRLIQAAAR